MVQIRRLNGTKKDDGTENEVRVMLEGGDHRRRFYGCSPATHTHGSVPYAINQKTVETKISSRRFSSWIYRFLIRPPYLIKALI